MAVISAIAGKKAAKKAASRAEGQLRRAEGEQREAREQFTPFIETGEDALEQLNIALGLRGREAQQGFFQNFQTDPGFQQTVDFGLGSIIDRQSALGLRQSGGTLKALQNFGQLQLQDAFNRRLDRFAGLAQGGLGAASNFNNATQGIASTIAGIGQARASAPIGGFNALSAGLQNTGDFIAAVLGGQSGKAAGGGNFNSIFGGG